MLELKAAKVLLFMEDPGAVNFLAELPRALNAKKITSTVIADGLAINNLRKRNVGFETRVVDLNANEIINRVQPKVVVLGTSDNKNSFAFELIMACRKAQITTVGAIDIAANAQYRFKGNSDNPLKYSPDFLVVPDLMTQKEFENLRYPVDKIFECGHPHYDYVAAKGKKLESLKSKRDTRISLFPNLDPDKLLVPFLSQPVSQLVKKMMERNDDYTLSGWGDSDRRTDIVLQELIDALSPYRDSINFGVRLHPKNTLDEFDRYKSQLNFVDNKCDSLELVHASELAIGMSTMLLFEAALMGVKTLSVLPRISEADWLPVSARKSVPIVCTRLELKVFLDEFFSNGEKQIQVSSQFDFEPGALNRLCDFVCNLI
ncbi:MAG: hypothetical protein SFY67_08910 [Candidatus Melainabacteria bacterium]|nr:hypothetical protein [Candidatus Melainabacteria bacterium]